MKKLVLAEKPSVARDISKAIGANQNRNGYTEGSNYIVTWALGHLVTLAEPEEYNKKYSSWNLDDLPMIPEKAKLTIIKNSKKQFYIVKELLERKDVGEIIIATDAGREGELVARWIIDLVKVNKPIKRLWISSVTEKAIKDGFSKLKDGKEYINLYYSAQARAEADWLVGINATRALTVKHNSPLSLGRVQTPTLQMIAKREEEIRNFVPRAFYGIKAECEGFTLNWIETKSKDTKTFDKDIRDQVLSKVKGSPGVVVNVEKKYKKEYPKELYDLTQLQRDANQRFGYSPKDTLSIVQSLYEHHKVLTYPRTDSKYLTSDMVGTIKDRLIAINTGSYREFVAPLLKENLSGNKNFVDNSKVSDHHAIIPTEQSLDLSQLSEKERKVFDLVAKRFISMLYPPFEYEETTVMVEVNKQMLVGKGRVLKELGFKKVLGQEDDDRVDSLPELKIGDRLTIKSISGTEGKTSPPKRFTEGNLLQAMENPVKFMNESSKELKAIISDTGGIGTVATRADIIDKLYKSFLIENRGTEIMITGKGKQLLDLAPEDLKSPELTATWEKQLKEIESGKLKKDDFLKNIKKYTKEIIMEIKDSDATFKHDN
ncbi:MAG: DNA topoisomerase III, partial [Clostridia bacterium]|nr:DNA topoisomerase III [Clostridia bacterium]